MNKNITVPKELEPHMDEALKRFELDYTKSKDLDSSSLWPLKEENGGKKQGKFVIYSVKLNETIAFVLGMEVRGLINKSS